MAACDLQQHLQRQLRSDAGRQVHTHPRVHQGTPCRLSVRHIVRHISTGLQSRIKLLLHTMTASMCSPEPGSLEFERIRASRALTSSSTSERGRNVGGSSTASPSSSSEITTALSVHTATSAKNCRHAICQRGARARWRGSGSLHNRTRASGLRGCDSPCGPLRNCVPSTSLPLGSRHTRVRADAQPRSSWAPQAPSWQ